MFASCPCHPGPVHNSLDALPDAWCTLLPRRGGILLQMLTDSVLSQATPGRVSADVLFSQPKLEVLPDLGMFSAFCKSVNDRPITRHLFDILSS